MPNASLTIDGTEVIKKENGIVSSGDSLGFINGDFSMFTITSSPNNSGGTMEFAEYSSNDFFMFPKGGSVQYNSTDKYFYFNKTGIYLMHYEYQFSRSSAGDDRGVLVMGLYTTDGTVPTDIYQTDPNTNNRFLFDRNYYKWITSTTYAKMSSMKFLPVSNINTRILFHCSTAATNFSVSTNTNEPRSYIQFVRIGNA